MASFPGGTARVIDRNVYPTYIEYVVRVTPSDASGVFDLRVQANGTVADLKAKGKAAIAAYLASIIPPPADNIPSNASLAVAVDGTLS